jgi:uncharacterized protein
MTKRWPHAWMSTYTGRIIYPLELDIESIDIIDIAHSLSNICRYNGHTNRFYSVAEHCIHLCHIAPDEYKLWALLHDASEAYLNDMTSPIKWRFQSYRLLQERVMQLVAKRFNLPYPIPPLIKELDSCIVYDEWSALMHPTKDFKVIGGHPNAKALGIRKEIDGYQSLRSVDIRDEFFNLYNGLSST